MPRIAIIGAGISGLTLANELSRRVDVTVFEKSRGVGGRMSTRYAEPFCFDHGTQFFTVRTPEFREFLGSRVAVGAIAEWNGDIQVFQAGRPIGIRPRSDPLFVPTPNMNKLCKSLAEGLNVKTNLEIGPLQQSGDASWIVRDNGGDDLGSFDWIISTAPPAQTVRMFDAHLPQEAAIRQAKMQGCYALLLGFPQRWDRPWIAANLEDNAIRWLGVNSTKPGRSADVACLVAHSRNDWAEAHIDDDIAQVQSLLLDELRRGTGIDGSTASYVSVHRWRYAIVDDPRQPGFFLDGRRRISSAGDWSVASRIEDVWLNARRLATAVTRLL